MDPNFNQKPNQNRPNAAPPNYPQQPTYQPPAQPQPAMPQPAYQQPPIQQPPPAPVDPSHNPLRMVSINPMAQNQPPHPDDERPPIAGSMDLPPEPPKKRKKRHIPFKGFFSTLGLFLMAPIIALFIAAFILQSYQVEGQSMEKTLQNSDRLIVNKLPSSVARVTHHPYIPKRGDIIIFNQAGLPDTTFVESKQLIKRVIGLPGERVVVSNGKVTIFNSSHPDGFNPDTQSGYKIDQTYTSGNVDLIVPDKEVFVLGDNRANSEDSRYFGPIQATAIVGKLSLRIMPFDHARHF